MGATHDHGRLRTLVELSALAVALMLFAPSQAGAAAGDLDLSFGGGDGLVVDDHDPVRDLAVMPDGRIVTIGTHSTGGAEAMALGRYLPGGAPDPTFGADGFVTLPTVGDGTQGWALKLLADGRIAAAGNALYAASNSRRPLVAVFHQNGTLDSTFGGTGIVTTDVSGLGANIGGFADVVEMPDGRVIGGGDVSGAGIRDHLLVRYQANGTLDPTFGTGGIATADYSGPAGVDGFSAMALQPNGKIVVAGSVVPNATQHNLPGQFTVFRYLQDGTPDPTFSDDGKVDVDFVNGSAAYDLALLADGRIVAAGSADADADPTTLGANVVVARLLPDGSLDPSFDGDGRVVTPIADVSRASSVALQSDGKIVVGGDILVPGETDDDAFVARYLEDGSLDQTFGASGISMLEAAPESNDVIADVAIAPDGKTVVGGGTGPGAPTPFHTLLARYLDTDADDDGISDSDEAALGTNPNDADSDDDGLADGVEITLGTSPLDPDTDDDGLADGAEVTLGTNPLVADSDADGLPDGTEAAVGTSPLDADSDDDGLIDGKDVEFMQGGIGLVPDDAFKSSGQKTALNAMLDEVESFLDGGDIADAVAELTQMRKKVDGCGSEAGKDDWIVDCAQQLEIRELVDLLITNLGAS